MIVEVGIASPTVGTDLDTASPTQSRMILKIQINIMLFVNELRATLSQEVANLDIS